MKQNCDCENSQILAMAFVEKQKWNEVYDAKIGLSRGTIFPALDKPFFGREACPCGK